MPVCRRISWKFLALLVAAAALSTGLFAQGGNAMINPFRMLENWPHLGDIKPGAAIGIVPDGKGGVWLQHRSEPAILHRLRQIGALVCSISAALMSSRSAAK